GFNQDFPLAGMIRLADDTLLLHAFHQRGGAVVANLQPPLNIAGRRLAVARHDRHGLLIKVAALARAHRGGVENRVAVLVVRIFGVHSSKISRNAFELKVSTDRSAFSVDTNGPCTRLMRPPPTI